MEEIPNPDELKKAELEKRRQEERAAYDAWLNSALRLHLERIAHSNVMGVKNIGEQLIRILGDKQQSYVANNRTAEAELIAKAVTELTAMFSQLKFDDRRLPRDFIKNVREKVEPILPKKE
jgi:hypothetical protein